MYYVVCCSLKEFGYAGIGNDSDFTEKWRRITIFLSSLQNTKNTGHILVLKSRDFLCLGLLGILQTGGLQADTEVFTGLLSCTTQPYKARDVIIPVTMEEKNIHC